MPSSDSNTVAPAPPPPAEPPGPAWDSARLFRALTEADFEQFVAALPPYPVIVSPDAYIDTHDLRLTPRQWQDSAIYLFGFEPGTGDSMNYIPEYFFIQFLAKPWHRGIRTIDSIPPACRGNTLHNIHERWPDAHFVNYCLPGSEKYAGMDWAALRIVWRGDSLLAIVRDAWTP